VQAALQKNRYPMNVDGAIGAILADLGMKQAGFNGIFMIAHARVDRACYRRTSPRKTDAPHRSSQSRLRRAARAISNHEWTPMNPNQIR